MSAAIDRWCTYPAIRALHNFEKSLLVMVCRLQFLGCSRLAVAIHRCIIRCSSLLHSVPWSWLTWLSQLDFSAVVKFYPVSNSTAKQFVSLICIRNSLKSIWQRYHRYRWLESRCGVSSSEPAVWNPDQFSHTKRKIDNRIGYVVSILSSRRHPWVTSSSFPRSFLFRYMLLNTVGVLSWILSRRPRWSMSTSSLMPDVINSMRRGRRKSSPSP